VAADVDTGKSLEGSGNHARFNSSNVGFSLIAIKKSFPAPLPRSDFSRQGAKTISDSAAPVADVCRAFSRIRPAGSSHFSLSFFFVDFPKSGDKSEPFCFPHD
jgi:hypothetical protein